jgi:hypothetical protein
MEFCGWVDYHDVGLMQEIFKQDECAKVCSGADENKDDSEPIWWRYEDFREFHMVVLCERFSGCCIVSRAGL